MIVFMLMLGPLVISILVKAINSIVLVVSFISVKLTSCPAKKRKKKKILVKRPKISAQPWISFGYTNLFDLHTNSDGEGQNYQENSIEAESKMQIRQTDSYREGTL